MSTDLPRRRLLQLGALLPLGLPLASALAGDVRLALVELGSARGVLAAGDHLLVDSACRDFSGEGLYLYPAWGRPAAYAVRRSAAGELEFRQPGGAELAWRAAPSQSGAFAGRVVEVISAAEGERIAWLHARHRPLRVPDLPAA